MRKRSRQRVVILVTVLYELDAGGLARRRRAVRCWPGRAYHDDQEAIWQPPPAATTRD